LLGRSSNLPAGFGFSSLALGDLFASAYRASTPKSLEEERLMSLPIWSCSVWGLPCRPTYAGRGALLPHPFTLTFPSLARRAWRFAFCCTGRPAAFGRQSRTLSGTLPFGVRTFLPRRIACAKGGSDRPAACRTILRQVGRSFPGEADVVTMWCVGGALWCGRGGGGVQGRSGRSGRSGKAAGLSQRSHLPKHALLR